MFSCVSRSFYRVKTYCCHGNDRCGMTVLVLVFLPHISGSKGVKKKLLVPEVAQFIEACNKFETLLEFLEILT